MAHPQMMKMLLSVYPALWNIEVTSPCQDQDVTFNANYQEDELFNQIYSGEPSKSQKDISQSKTWMEDDMTTHKWKNHDSIFEDEFFQSYTTTTVYGTNVPNDMAEESRIVMSVETPLFNEDNRKLKSFQSVPEVYSNTGRRVSDDLELESTQILTSDNVHHLLQLDDEDEYLSLYSNDILIALDGIHVDAENTVETNLGTVPFDVMQSCNRN
jgi:hypothetical protein